MRVWNVEKKLRSFPKWGTILVKSQFCKVFEKFCFDWANLHNFNFSGCWFGTAPLYPGWALQFPVKVAFGMRKCVVFLGEVLKILTQTLRKKYSYSKSHLHIDKMMDFLFKIVSIIFIIISNSNKSYRKTWSPYPWPPKFGEVSSKYSHLFKRNGNFPRTSLAQSYLLWPRASFAATHGNLPLRELIKAGRTTSEKNHGKICWSFCCKNS